MGNERDRTDNLKDIGGFEYALDANPVQPHATEDNTGPFYLLDTPVSSHTIPTFNFDLRVFPNPSTNTINLAFNLPQAKIGSISIFDETGKMRMRVLDHYLFHKGLNEFSTPLKSLGSGWYVVKMNFEKQEILEKFIITR